MATARIIGLKEMQARMRAVPPILQAAIRPEIQRGVEQMTARARELVPVEKPPGDHKNRPPGTLKAAIEWHWIGTLAAVITDRPPAIRNLGLWIERGTSGGERGSTRGYFTTRGKLRNRKVYRTHSGTKPEPYMGPAFRAFSSSVKANIRAAIKRAVGN